MENRIRYILASGVLGAALCAMNVASYVDDELVTSVNFGVASAFAQDDDDPFADSDEEDPFASPAADDNDDDDSDSDVADADADADDDEANPFGGNADSSNAPFAQSSLPTKKPAVKPAAEPVELTPEEQARAEERAKYARAADVPDEFKTEADFYETASAAELSALHNSPTNDAEWFCAAVRVARVGRPNFAKILVAKALESPAASPEEAAKLLDTLGSGRAVYFVANPAIGPVGSQVYEKVLDSAKKYWESGAALNDAFARATSGSVDERAQGVTDARKGGVAAIKLLASNLVVGAADEQAAAAQLLPFFETDAVDALVACVRAANDEQLPAFAAAIADFADLRVGPELAARYYLNVDGPAAGALEAALAKQYKQTPTAAEFSKFAYEKALEYYRGVAVLPNLVDGNKDVWDWNPQGEALTCVELPKDVVMRAEAARWALVAYLVGEKVGAAPAGSRNLAICAVAERNAHRVGLDAARQGVDGFEADLPGLSVDDLVASVKYALETGHYAAALIPTVILQKRGDESLCYASSGAPSVIVQAATCPDRRVRYQALAAIVKWNPTKPYVGSSRVAASLEWFATSVGEKAVVVAAPKLAVANQIGQAFSTAGYRVIPVTTGREALRAAQECADVELVFITSSVSAPNAGVLAQALRGDFRTADVPLLVGDDEERQAIDERIRSGRGMKLAIDENPRVTNPLNAPEEAEAPVSVNPTTPEERVKAAKLSSSALRLMVDREPNALVLPTPYAHDAASWAIQKLNDRASVAPVPAEIRLKESKSCAAALGSFLVEHPSIYELDDVNALLRRLLATPALFDEGLELAATVKTPYAQKALVELAGDTRFGVAVRRGAVDAFERQLAANGLLLRGPDVVAMYNRYNASEKEDAQTQKVLSDLLDVYEKATGK